MPNRPLTPLRWRAVVVIFAFMGWSSLTTGWAYAPWAGGSDLDLPPGLALAAGFVGIGFWSAIWMLSGALCVVAAFRGLRRPWFEIASASQIFIITFWLLAYYYAWLEYRYGLPPGPGDPRGYLPTSTYARQLEASLLLLLLIEWVRRKVPPDAPTFRQDLTAWWRRKRGRGIR